jgi:hypothetical protein
MTSGDPNYVPTTYQYRVCWRRAGGQWRAKVFARRSAAERLAYLLSTADHLHYLCEHPYQEINGPDDYRCIEPIEEGPRIDRRKVGNWQTFDA